MSAHGVRGETLGMPARPGTRHEITPELRAVLHRAFTQHEGLTYPKLAELIEQQNPGMKRPEQTTLKRIIDPNDPKRVAGSAILGYVMKALGVPEQDEGRRVTFNREEIELLNAWATLRAANKPAALAILADVKRRAELARVAAEAAAAAGAGLPSAEEAAPETKTTTPER